MASVNTYLNERYKKKDGTCSVYVYCYVHRQKVRFNTGVSVLPSKWDGEKKRVKGTSNQAKDMNMIIDNCRKRIHDVFVRYRLQNKELTPELLKKEYKTPTTYVDFYDFYRRKVEDQKGLVADNTIKVYWSVYHKLQLFKKELYFSMITVDFLKEYQKFMKHKLKNGQNTIRKHMGILKGFLSMAVQDGIISENPFKFVQIKGQQSDRMYLEPDELHFLWNIYNRKDGEGDPWLPGNLQKVLRQYLFSCFTGLRISDIQSITHENIIGDKIVFQPYKQKSKIVKIKLIPAAQQLIKDAGPMKVQGKIFDCYSDQVTNRLLKRIADLAEIPKRLSFHSGRHTFATMFLRKTKNIAALQQMLGHTNIRETMIYSHILENDIDKDMDLFGEDF